MWNNNIIIIIIIIIHKFLYCSVNRWTMDDQKTMSPPHVNGRSITIKLTDWQYHNQIRFRDKNAENVVVPSITRLCLNSGCNGRGWCCNGRDLRQWSGQLHITGGCCRLWHRRWTIIAGQYSFFLHRSLHHINTAIQFTQFAKLIQLWQFITVKRTLWNQYLQTKLL